MSPTPTKCQVCMQTFPSLGAMQRHFNETHRNAVGVNPQEVPDSTVTGALPAQRCENCRFWGKGNNITVCRRKPGVPAMVQSVAGPQCVALYPPALGNEWCGDWDGTPWPLAPATAPPSPQLS